jgi:predicted ATPase
VITQISATNFKSWADTGKIRLAPLTGFFGTNSSGKTSLLQILLLLKQTAASSDRNMVLQTEGSLVSLGTLRDVLHGDALSTSISLDWKPSTPIRIDPITLDNLSFSSYVTLDGGIPVIERITYKGERFSGNISRSEKKRDRYQIEVLVDNREPRRIQGRPPNIGRPIKCYGFPGEALQYYQDADYLSDFNYAFEQLFGSVFYLGPMREDPKRIYQILGNRPDDVGRKGELAIAALATAGEDRDYRPSGKPKARKISLAEKIAAEMKAMGLIESFRVEQLVENINQYQVLIKRTEQSREVPIVDLGFGISQVLPVLVICYYSPQKSTIILEQPEIHLHPSAQSALADVLIDAVKARNVQIIFESHSEHLIRRLQRRITEETIKKEDIALYFCSMEGGKSQLTELELSEYGDILNWPDGFFGDLTGDLIEMTESSIQRQLQLL